MDRFNEMELEITPPIYLYHVGICGPYIATPSKATYDSEFQLDVEGLVKGGRGGGLESIRLVPIHVGCRLILLSPQIVPYKELNRDCVFLWYLHFLQYVSLSGTYIQVSPLFGYHMLYKYCMTQSKLRSLCVSICTPEYTYINNLHIEGRS